MTAGLVLADNPHFGKHRNFRNEIPLYGLKPGNDHKQSEAGLTTNRVLGHHRERCEFAHERYDCEPNQLQKGQEHKKNAEIRKKM
jgi:hypothetical protein